MPTLREQLDKAQKSGATNQDIRDALKETYGIDDTKLLVPYMDMDVKDIKAKLKPASSESGGGTVEVKETPAPPPSAPTATSTAGGRPAPTARVSTQPAPSPTQETLPYFMRQTGTSFSLAPPTPYVFPEAGLSPTAQRIVTDYNTRLQETRRRIQEAKAKAEATPPTPAPAPSAPAPFQKPTPAPTQPQREEGRVVVPLLQEAVEMFVPAEAYEYLPDFMIPSQGYATTQSKAGQTLKQNIQTGTVQTRPELKYAPTLELGPSQERTLKVGKGILEELVFDLPSDVATYLQNLAVDLATGFSGGGAPMGQAPAGTTPTRFTKKEESKTFQVIGDMEKALQDAKKEQSEKSGLQRTAEFPVAILSGAKDVVIGFADILNYLGGVNVRVGETRSQEAERKGAEILGGMLGMTAESVRNFANPTAWETRPVEQVLGLLPIIEFLAPKVGGLPAFKQTVEATRKVASGVKESRVGTKARQAQSEGFATREPATSAFTEQMFRTPEAEASAVKEAGTRVAKEVREPTPPVIEQGRIVREGGEPVVEEIQKPMTNVDYVNEGMRSPSQERVITAVTPDFPDSQGGVVAKRKYLTGDLYNYGVTTNLPEGGFELRGGGLNEVDYPVVAGKVKELLTDNKRLAGNLGTVANEASALSQSLFGTPDIPLDLETVTQTYNRMLAENVDGARTNLREGIANDLRKELTTRGYTAKAGMLGDLNALADKLTEFVIADSTVASNKARIQGLLTDTVVPPARTTELYAIESKTGKLVKGDQAVREISKDLDQRLRGLTPEERAKYVAGEGEPVFRGETQPVREFRRQQLEQQGTKQVETQTGMGFGEAGRATTQPYRTQNPFFNDAVKEVADIVRRQYPEGAEGVITPERIASRFAIAIDNQLSNFLPLVRSPKIREAVLRFAKERLEQSGFSKQEVARIIRDLDKDVLRDAVTSNNTGKIRGFEIVDANKNPVIRSGDLVDVIAQQDPTIIREAKAQAVLDLTNDLAKETQYFATRKMIQNEGMRFIRDPETGKVFQDFVRNPEVFVVPMLGRIILKGETNPVFLPFEGRKLASIIDTNLDNYTRLLADAKQTELGRPLTAPEMMDIRTRIIEQSNRLKDFVPLDLSMIDETMGGFAEQYRAVKPETSIFENLYAPAEVASAIQWELMSKKALQNPTAGLGVFQSAKRNLTARALTALKNNNLSNSYALGLKNGDPFIMYNVFKDGFLDFWFGDRTKMSPEKVRAYQALERSGLIDTTELAQDIGKSYDYKPMEALIRALRGEEGVRSAEANGAYKLVSKLNSKYDSAMRMLESTYSKAGDIPFKIYEGVRAYTKYNDSLSRVKEGKYVGGKISKNVEARLTKTAPDFYEVEFVDTKGNPVPSMEGVSGTLNSPQISQVLGRMSAFEANKIILDYSDVGTWNKVLKSYPILNAMSGFYTYYWKTLDIPFIKRGMFANMLFPEEFVTTNDPVLAKQNLNKATLASLRRTLVINGALGQVFQREGQTPDERRALELAKKSVGFSPKETDAILLAPIGDLSQQYYNDFGNTIPLKSTDVLTKVGAGTLVRVAGFLSPQDFEKQLFPLYKDLEQRETDKTRLEKDRKAMGLFLKDLRGELFTAKDVLSLVGQGGNSVFDILDDIGNTDEQGKVFSFDKMSQRFGETFMGRTPYALVMNAFGGAGALIEPPQDPSKPTYLEATGERLRALTPYAKEQKKYGFVSGTISPDLQNYTMYLLSQIIGSGWKKVNLLDEKEDVVTGSVLKSRFENYLEGARKELDATLVNPLKDKARQYKGLADNEKDPTRKAKYEETFQFYQKNVESVQEQIKELLDKDRTIMDKVLVR